MIYHFILNPKSGRPRRHQNLESVIKSACRQRKLSYHIYYTTCAGDATEYVRSMIRISDDRQRFICVGGDGTLNELANSAPSNSNIEIGVIPYGSGNDFVRNFTNKELFSDIEAQIDGSIIAFDLIKCNEFYSVNLTNIGFDCACAAYASKMKKYKFISPAFSYTLGVLNTFFKPIGTKMKLTFDDGEVWNGTYTLATVANGMFYGGGYCAAPKAALTDGIMEVCTVKKISRLKFISMIGKYKSGEFFDYPKILSLMNHKRVSHFKMEFQKPEAICLDGEIRSAQAIDFTIIPAAFNFVLPAGTQYLGAKIKSE